jgi:predicted nucleic acid-binding protein
MTVVVDASVLVETATGSSHGEAARYRVHQWISAAEDVHVPQLFTYEVASSLVRLEAEAGLPPRVSDDVWRLVDVLYLTFHPPSGGRALIAIAHRLQRSSVYDAAYIDVALTLGAELWTLDGKLARNAASVGFPVTLVV